MNALGALDVLSEMTFERFQPEGVGLPVERQRILRLAYDTALSFAAHPRGWLLLTGGYGVGKTHLAAAIGNALMARGERALFVLVPDLLDHLRAAYAPNSIEPYDELFERLKNAPLLILDDLGAEAATPWAQEKLFMLLNHRYLHRLATVITTNQPIEALVTETTITADGPGPGRARAHPGRRLPRRRVPGSPGGIERTRLACGPDVRDIPHSSDRRR